MRKGCVFCVGLTDLAVHRVMIVVKWRGWIGKVFLSAKREMCLLHSASTIRRLWWWIFCCLRKRGAEREKRKPGQRGILWCFNTWYVCSPINSPVAHVCDVLQHFPTCFLFLVNCNYRRHGSVKVNLSYSYVLLIIDHYRVFSTQKSQNVYCTSNGSNWDAPYRVPSHPLRVTGSSNSLWVRTSHLICRLRSRSQHQMWVLPISIQPFRWSATLGNKEMGRNKSLMESFVDKWCHIVAEMSGNFPFALLKPDGRWSQWRCGWKRVI